MKAKAELDLTDFGDAGTFLKLIDRHGLIYGGLQDSLDVEDLPPSPSHSWTSENLEMLTSCNPVDGVHVRPQMREIDEGYASYITINGDVDAAKELYLDILHNAEYLKGESRPLTTENGNVVMSLHDVKSEKFDVGTRKT